MNQIQRASTGFAQVKNEVLYDNTISLKAKGLFAYLYAKPETWEFSGDRIAEEMKEGRKAIYNTLKELETAGYLFRDKKPSGKVIYHLFYDKKPDALKGQQGKKPDARFGKEPKRQVAERGSISNKEKKEIKRTQRNKELATPSVADNVQKVFEKFQMTINPTINYGNKTQRKAAEELLKRFGEQKVLRMIEYCASIKDKKFAPTVTTPYQLKEKMAQVIAYYNKNNNKSPNVVSI